MGAEKNYPGRKTLSKEISRKEIYMEIDAVNIVRRKKFFILCAATLLMFFTSMNKVLVPGAVFSDMQSSLNLTGGELAAMGASFMYCYALSQLVLGLLCHKFGGVRILLIGGGLFTFGSILFPLMKEPFFLIAARGITGIGAGTVFIALAKLIADIFPKKFSTVLGLTLFIGYLGPVAGGLPFVSFVKAAGWRNAFFSIGAIIVTAMILIIVLSPGTLKKIRGSESIFSPLWIILRNPASNFLSVTSMIIFGSHYMILSTIGQKTLEDYGHFSHYSASLWMSVLAGIVASCNLGSGAILAFFGNKRRKILLSAASLCLAGGICGTSFFTFSLPGYLTPCVFILLALPAGCFPLYGTHAKELNPPEHVGLSVAMLNFFAFIGIAIGGNAAGIVLSRYESVAKKLAGGVIHYPAEAYRDIFIVITFFALLGLISAFFVPETFKKQEK